MAEPIPTRRGDVLIWETKDSNFDIHAVGPANDGDQDFFTGMNVKYERDRAAAVDAAKAMASPGSTYGLLREPVRACIALMMACTAF